MTNNILKPVSITDETPDSPEARVLTARLNEELCFRSGHARTRGRTASTAVQRVFRVTTITFGTTSKLS